MILTIVIHSRQMYQYLSKRGIIIDMKRINTAPISGMMELTPLLQVSFDNLKEKIAQTYARHGYLHIETPSIERSEILLAKAGGETEKQIYKVVKTAETADEADQALRFDHTVPLARYVVEHENALSFPFKVTQLARNFRGERAQKGRYREFYQCDVDVVGRSSLPIYYDADVISTLLDTFASFNLKTPVLARINNRKIVSGLIDFLGLKEWEDLVFRAIDRSEKVSAEETKFVLREAGFPEDRMMGLMEFIGIHGARGKVVEQLRGLGVTNEEFLMGVNELDEVMGLLEATGYRKRITADMRIVRGLDYYTGTVFEFILPAYKRVGSVCGGGRYENLAGNFSEGNKFPGVGGSIGLSRLFYILNDEKLLPNVAEKAVEYAVIPLSEAEVWYAMKVAAKLREEEGAITTVVVMDKKLGDRLNYAAKIARKAIVLGENEVETGTWDTRVFN